ncbi:hypothetical protein [Bacillus siamensis]|uniref:hypothetical protein n=1 Tax=Bacillus siamensis TaxID=659243 RepID=UPI000648EC90|nr:hypothetical protein [Bacillus siamensis]
MAETKEYVQIKKAPCRSIWYADKIGSIFPSLGTWENAYKVDSPDRALYIRKEDAELIITENRRPKVDERVLITEVLLSSSDYKIGDICTVRSVVDAYGTITVKENANCVLAREYEVIINSEVKNEEANGMKREYAFKPNLDAMGYDELIAHGEGYRQGKFDAETDTTHGQAPAHKSAQVLRDEIVEMAKADVENLKAYGKQSSRSTSLGNLTYREYYYSVEFKVSSNKRKVSALIYPIGRLGFISGRPIHVGRAKAAPDDCFNVHIGKAIALRRALGLTVPDEYLNAPQPTEVRVGDVIEVTLDSGEIEKKPVISLKAGSLNAHLPGRIVQYPSHYAKIIDDSREEVGE